MKSVFHSPLSVVSTSMDKIATKRLVYEYQVCHQRGDDERSLSPFGRGCLCPHAVRWQGRKIYEWEQSLEEIHVYVEVPPGVRAKMLDVKITATQLSIGLKGNPPFIGVRARSPWHMHA